MRYKSSGALRQALEEKLRQQSIGTGTPLVWLRKLIAFDRFLARLVQHDAEAWIIKGGLALQLRLGDRARTTRDIDATLGRAWKRRELADHLRRAGSLPLRDFFEFEVSEPQQAATGAPAGGFRFPIRCLLDGRSFENFHLDIGVGDAVVGEIDLISGPNLLGFAEISPAKVPCCPLATQVAEKLHAYSRPYVSGGSTRIRDLVDILLIGTLEAFRSRRLFESIEATFSTRGTHPVPTELPDPPANLSAPYRKLSRELRLVWTDLREGFQAAKGFLNPVLSGKKPLQWDPARWSWIS